MPAPKGKLIPADALLQLRQRLDHLPPKIAERAVQVASVADLYGVSAATVYRALQRVKRPHAAQIAHFSHGMPRLGRAIDSSRRVATLQTGPVFLDMRMRVMDRRERPSASERRPAAPE